MERRITTQPKPLDDELNIVFSSGIGEVHTPKPENLLVPFNSNTLAVPEPIRGEVPALSPEAMVPPIVRTIACCAEALRNEVVGEQLKEQERMRRRTEAEERRQQLADSLRFRAYHCE